MVGTPPQGRGGHAVSWPSGLCGPGGRPPSPHQLVHRPSWGVPIFKAFAAGHHRRAGHNPRAPIAPPSGLG